MIQGAAEETMRREWEWKGIDETRGATSLHDQLMMAHDAVASSGCQHQEAETAKAASPKVLHRRGSAAAVISVSTVAASNL